MAEKNRSWKRVIAGLLALTLVVGNVPANVGVGGLFGSSDIVASAEGAVPTIIFAENLTYNGEKQQLINSVTYNGTNALYLRVTGDNNYGSSWVRYDSETNISALNDLKATDAGSYNVYYYNDKIAPADTEAGTLVNSCSITKADLPTALSTAFTFTPPDNLVYNDLPKFATVTSTLNGIGQITIKYFSDEERTSEVTEAKETGTYYVGITVSDGTNYNGTGNVVVYDTNWKFDITSATQSWTSGDCTVTLNNGVLTVSKTEGADTGNMADYNGNDFPWFDYIGQITSINFTDDVTYIGNSAFRNCSQITSLTIPGSVTGLGVGAFALCPKLASVTISDGVNTIGRSAFNSCYGLTSITIPNSVTNIGNYAFYGCSNLANVTFETPQTNATLAIGYYAFANTKSGATVAVGDGNTSLFDGTTKITSGTALTDIQSKTLTWKNTIVNTWTSGDCTVTLDDEGKLTVSKTEGKTTGNMKEYLETLPEWYDVCDQITSVVIENGVTSIGAFVFCYCSNLASVTIPNSVTSIGDCAFYDCSNLASVTIPNSVTSIGEVAFSDCSNLENVTIPNSVTSIGNGAFANCSNLASVTFTPGTADATLAIGNNAFANTKSGATVAVGDGNTSLFDGTTKITSGTALTDIQNKTLTWKADVQTWTSGNCTVTLDDEGTLTVSKTEGAENGNMANYSSFSNRPWNNVRDQITSVVIENGVTFIGKNAFRRFTNVTSVTIPNSVTNIGNFAFASCSDLASVTIPNSVTSIGGAAFAGCSNLASVTFIPGTANNTLSIGENAFDDTKAGTKVAYGDGDTMLFNGTNKITTDTLLRAIQSKTLTWKNTIVGRWTSGNCTVTLDDEGTLTVSKTEGKENGNMANYDGVNNRPWNDVRDQITSVVIENGVTFIGKNAFRNCQNMTNVAIADTVTGMGESAFYGCNGLTSVTLPNSVTTIGGSAFDSCSGLTSITIPNSVTNIGNYAFYGCSNLASVTFTPAAADTTLSIGNQAFNGTKAGTKVAYADGENTNKLFDGTNKITTDTLLTDLNYKTLTWKADVQTWTSGDCTVTLDNEGKLTVSKNEGETTGNMANYSSSSNRPWHGVRDQITSVVIENGVTSIGKNAFRDCQNMTNVAIADTVTGMEESAFYGCNGLTSVTLPNSVTSIGGYAFSDCSSLTSVTIPNSVTSIGTNAFAYCSNLASVTFTPGTADATLEIGEDAFDVTKAGAKVAYTDGENTNKLFDGTNKITTDTLLTAIQGKTLTWKADVQTWTSGSCTVTLDNEGKLTVSKTEGAPNGNMADYQEDPPEWHSVREDIKNVVIENGVTNIGMAAFQSCSNLANVTIPNSVTNIGAFAFVGCSGLTSVTIPNSVTSIGDGAFAGCSNLASVTMPNSVTSIGTGAFYECSNLASVTILNSVTSIGTGAFYNCSNLASVTFTPGTADATLSIGNQAFDGTKDGAKVAYADGDTKLFDGTNKITTDTLLTDIQDKSLTWKVPVDVTGIELNKNETTIIRGSDETLTAIVSPDNATVKSVEWTSSNEEVATVDSTGKVTAIKAGTVTITATATNGTASTSDDKTATCTVKVLEKLKAENITIDDVTYNGAIHRPVLKFDDDTVLKEGRDYEIVPTNGDIANAQDVGRYTIHINGIGYYSGENIELTWRIVKADYTVADIFAMKPSAKTVTYNGEDQEVIQAPEVMPYFGTEISYKVSDRKLTANELEEFYSNEDGWTDSAENLKQKDAGTYYYYFKISDPNHNAYPNGNQFTVVDAEFLCLTAEIKKSDPEFGGDITGTSLNCGQSLENSTINGESNVPGTFTWKDDSIVPKVSDSNITEYDAVFTPNDTDNYNTVDVKVKVIVSSANKNDLEYTIGEAEEYYNDIKEDEAYAEPAGELYEAIQSAKAVFNNTDATEDEVSEAYNDLADAVDKAEDDVDKIDDENAAKAVDDKIDEIGEVELTDECKAKIDDAKEALDDLTPDQKKLVKNKNVIDYAQKAYDALVAKAAAEAAEERANTTANEMRRTATNANNAKIAAENAKKAAEDAQKAAEDAKKVAEDKQKEAEDALAQGLADANDKVEKANKAKEAAENAQHEAESKQADAENKMTNAEKAKAEAEQAKEEAEKAQQEAEQARQIAEEKQAEAEQAQKEAEDKQKAAEEALENGQAEAEDKVTEAEQAQKEAEDKQKAAEDKQKEAEDKLKAAEEALAKAQADAEQAKKTADEKLAAAEKAQKAAEDAREKGLADADEKVKAAEQAQKEAEDAKKAAEEKQADAEKAKKEADAVAASVVSDVLNALPDAKDITKDNAADVEAARKAYDKLNDAQKALVDADALQKLTDDEKAVAALNDDEKIVKGDANGDGKVDVTDIAMIASHIKGIKPLSENGFKAADVNGDGKVDVTDIALVASHIKGIKALQ